MKLDMMRSAVGRVLMAVGGLGLVGLLLVTALPLAHLTARPVLSGSMEPSITTGSLLVTKPVDVETVHVGDVVTAHIGDDFLTHRVVDTTAPGDPGALITRGDANDANDAPIKKDWIVGAPVLSVPYLGQVLLWSQSGFGFLGLVLTPLLLMLTGAALRPRARRRTSDQPTRDKLRLVA